jgi:putative phage-type endonuclease
VNPPILVVPGTAERSVWLQARRAGIGASDVAAVIGVSPYQGPLHVWLSKTGQYDVPPNAAMRWGTRFEDDVMDEFIERHPELVVIRSPGMYADPTEPWRMASLDGEAVGDDGLTVVEIKTGQSRWTDKETWGEPGTDEIPLHYLCQVTWACLVRQATRWQLAFLPLDNLDGYAEYRGEFSPELATQLATRVGAFHRDHVLAGAEPDADGLADTTEILAAMRGTRKLVTRADLPADAQLWQQGYLANHRAVAEFTAAKAEYGNLLRQALLRAGAERGYVDGDLVVSWTAGPAGKPSLKVKGV